LIRYIISNFSLSVEHTEDWIGLRALDQVGKRESYRALDQVYHIKLLSKCYTEDWIGLRALDQVGQNWFL
jgi:hypothetical protein